MLLDAAGDGLAILKVSNPAEDPATLDMEALVAFHAVRADPGLAVAQPRRAPAADAGRGRACLPGPVGARRRRPLAARLRPAARTGPAGPAHPARPGPDRLGRDDRPARAGAAQLHPPQRDPHAAVGRPARRHASARCSSSIRDRATRADRRGGARPVRRRASLPRWSALRAQVIHSDLTADNVLADDDGLITGIIDFGDLSHTRAGRRPRLGARLAGDGPRRRRDVPGGPARPGRVRAGRCRSSPSSAQVMGELWAARAAVGVAIGSWRASEGLEEPAFAERLNETALVMMDHMLTTGWDAHGAGARGRGHRTGARFRRCPDRRDAVFGPAMEPLSYDEPIEMAVGQRRVDDGHRRPPLPGHVQQRGLRRAQPPARDVGRRPAVARAEHQHALPAPRRHRARRAPASRPARRSWTPCCS